MPDPFWHDKPDHTYTTEPIASTGLTLPSQGLQMISFFVAGIPQQQGSTRAFVVKGRAVTTSANKNLRPWRTAVSQAMQENVTELHEGAWSVSMEFIMPRTKVLGKKRKPYTKTPDLDKLTRSVLDSGTGIIWRDDALVTRISAKKRYAELGEQTGLRFKAAFVDWQEEKPR